LQNIGAEKLGAGGAIDADVFVAGDDTEAVETVRSLLSELGLRSWHVGPLANSAAAEALTSVLIQLNRRYKLVQAGVRVTGSAKDAPKLAAGLSVFPVTRLPLFAAGDDLAGSIVTSLNAARMVLLDGDVLVVRLAPVLLGPEDPDARARALRKQLQARLDRRLAVIISDSLGRACRMGTTGAAIGLAGMRPLRDHRGETDHFGRVLQSAVVGVADEIASAASLVIGEGAEGLSVAIVRGASYVADDEASIGEFLRPLFR
jgi:F420-0:Gamma-glutamyl ligase